MVLALLFSVVLMWVATGKPLPLEAGWQAWAWLLGSGLVGYFLGDWCLFNSYVVMGSRFGQLFMTLAPAFTAFFAWTMIGQTLSWHSLLAMVVTLAGIAISILSRGDGRQVRLDLPLKGVLLGIGAGLGQGFGLVLSKIGMEHYAAAIPPDAPSLMETMLPFASTMIRAVIGGAGFLLILALQKNLGGFVKAVKDPVSMKYASLITLFGPALGVSLSLMAVRYANAGIASTLMALTPVIILLPEVLVNKKRIRFKEILGVVVSVTGVALFFLL